MSALLQGNALDVYSRMTTADAGNYDKLSEALLKRYQLTEEDHCLSFYFPCEKVYRKVQEEPHAEVAANL